jgi:hypothetical protein
MTQTQRRLGLLGLIAIELLGAVLVLRWALGPEAPEQKTRPTQAQIGGSNTLHATIWIAPDLPAAWAITGQQWAARQPDTLTYGQAADADLTVGWRKKLGSRPLAEIVLVPVVAFSSRRDDLSSGDLRRAWSDPPRAGEQGQPLFLSAETAAMMTALLGARGDRANVSIMPAVELADRLWSEPGALAIVPFDRLEPRLKALAVDGRSALDRDLDVDRYPLLVRLWADGPDDLVPSLIAEFQARELDTNRHLDRLSVLMMTGVTALTRGVALEIESRGDYGWPARRLSDLLAAADLTHISNEVSFSPDCVPQAEMRVFCAKPEYLASLQLLGADLVELTGNHNLDPGPGYALYSLDMYARAGMHTFGGGRNAAEAGQPLLITHHGNRLAFVGYNQFGPDYAWATEDQPGAARFAPEIVRTELAQLRPQVDLIFVNIQHTESYATTPLPEQVADFQATIQAGADVVTGSQAHQPQTIEFYRSGLIFYGLGNLIFDQTWSEPTRQGLVVRHVIYDGRLIASQLLPTVIGEDCQPRLAEGQETEAILGTLFAASGW